MKNLVRLLFLSLVAGVLPMVLVAAPAQADTYLGGGSSGGGGSCNGWVGTGWKLYGNKNATSRASGGSNNKTPAYEQASKLAAQCSGWGWSKVPNSLKNGCKKSTFIWIYRSAPGKFLYNAQSSSGIKAPRSTTNGGEIKKSLEGGGSAYYKSTVKDVKKAIDKYKPRSSKVLTLVCSFQYEYEPIFCPKPLKAPAAKGLEPKVSAKNRAGKSIPASYNTNAKRGNYCLYGTLRNTQYRENPGNTTSASTPLYWTSTVSNGGPVFGEDQAEKENIDSSDIGVKLTDFGKLAEDAVGNNKYPTPAELAKAIEASKTGAHAEVTVSDTNKKALAQGGVMNITERSNSGKLSLARPNQKRFVYYKLVYNVNSSGKAQGSPRWSNTISSPSAWKTTSGPTKVQILDETSSMTDMTQFLAVHCNDEGFNGAISGAVNIDNDDSTKAFSGAARKDNVNPNSPRWGLPSASNGTGTKGFYDKECGYRGENASTSEDNTKDSFVFFRDGAGGNHEMPINRYVPKDVPGLIDQSGADNKSALATFVGRWVEGTPKPPGASTGGQFKLLSEDGKSPFFSATAPEAPQQRNWEVSEYNSSTLGILPGETSNFIAEGNFASDDRKPNVFTVKWEYAPNVANTIPSKFTFTGSTPDLLMEKFWVPVQGKVQYRNDGVDSLVDGKEMIENSGSGSTNSLDGNPTLNGVEVDGSNKWTQNPVKYSPYYIMVNFVRATTE